MRYMLKFEDLISARIECRGKVGFFAVKYRETIDKIKLVKAVRFGKRKKARERSLQWHKEYYEHETS